MMIILKIIIAICLFSGIFFFFWYLQRTKIIEKGLATVRGSIEETAARRQIEAHANLLIRDQKNKSRLEKIIERPEKLYIYSRIGKIVKGSTRGIDSSRSISGNIADHKERYDWLVGGHRILFDY